MGRFFFKSKKKPRDTESSSSSGDYEVLGVAAVDRQRQRIIKQAKKHKLAFMSTNQRVVVSSIVVLLIATFFFASFIYWRLYLLQDYSDFGYNVTRVLPLPVARVGSSFVMYEDYLRELRRQVYYFEQQQQVDLSQPDQQNITTLDELKDLAMQRAVIRVYMQKLADQYDIPVTTEAEIDARLANFRQQNKIASEEDLEDILRTFWDMDLREHRLVVGDIILQEKVIKLLDQEFKQDSVLGSAQDRMAEIRRQLNVGQDFAEVAREHSEDINTAHRGGEYESLIVADRQQEHPKILEAIFATEVGEYSEIIDTGQRLVIIKVLADEGDGLRRVAHVAVFYIALSEVLQPVEEQQAVHIYIDGVEYFPGATGA